MDTLIWKFLMSFWGFLIQPGLQCTFHILPISTIINLNENCFYNLVGGIFKNVYHLVYPTSPSWAMRNDQKKWDCGYKPKFLQTFLQICYICQSCPPCWGVYSESPLRYHWVYLSEGLSVPSLGISLHKVLPAPGAIFPSCHLSLQLSPTCSWLSPNLFLGLYQTQSHQHPKGKARSSPVHLNGSSHCSSLLWPAFTRGNLC